MYIKTKSVNDAFIRVLKELKCGGAESAPRGMKVKELINVCVEIENPRDRIVNVPERNINMAYAFGELCWYLSGRNDLKMMKYYSRFMVRGTDDGETLNSAYGYRIFSGKHPCIPFNQFENVKRLLKKDPDSRQAIIHLHTPNNKKTNDEVCTLSLQFLIRNGKLDMITTMRSNDIVLGFTYDVFAFTMLQEILANELSVDLGKYFHNAGSMHIYENKYDLLKKTTNVALMPMKKFDWCQKDFQSIIKIEEFIRTSILLLDEHRADCNPEVFFEHMLKDVFDIVESKRNEEEKMGNLTQFAVSAFLLWAAKKVNVKTFNNAILDNMRKSNETYADILQFISNFYRGNKKVVIEGVDGAGKSTHAKEMSDHFQVQHYHKPTKTFGYFKNYMLNIENNIDTVFDRFFISEIVYSRVFKRKSLLSQEEISVLLRKCKERGVSFVFIVAKTREQLDKIKSRLKDEDKHFTSKIQDINNKYILIANELLKNGHCVKMKEVE